MADSNETNDILIKITHYINPQLFWYANIKTLQKIVNQLKELEINIAEHYKMNAPLSSTQHYEKGDMIILNYLPMNKLIRGRILHMEKGNPKVYIVWAIDYGYPIESNYEYIFRLPQQFQKSLGHIACGGIGYVVLDDNLINSHENSRFESILMKSKSLHFAKMFESSAGQGFGYLFIFEESRSYNALEYLTSNKLGRLSTVAFETLCTRLEATKKCLWQSMNGNKELSLAVKNSSNVEDLKCQTINDMLTKLTSTSTREILQTPPVNLEKSVKSKVDLDVQVKSKGAKGKQINSALPQIVKENNTLKQAVVNTSIVSTCGERSLRVDYMDHLVVAHANVPIEPIDHFNNVIFDGNIWSIMKQNRLDRLYRMQRIAWPHLLRGNRSLILINQPKSGRTWSYLPVLCSHVVKQFKKDLKVNRHHIFGPMAIVLVSDVKKAQYVATSCEMLLTSCTLFKGKVVTAFAGQDTASVRIQLHNGCGILITTPPQLDELLKHNVRESIFNPSKILYIVVDDHDLICSHYGTQFKVLFNDLLNVCKLRKSNHLKPQLVLTSQHWDSNFMTFFIKYARTPLLLFGDFLEAAAYAQVPLRMKIVNIDNKLQTVIDFLDNRVCDGRTIIYCNDDRSILMLQRQLEKQNFECLSYLKTSNIEVQENIRVWQCHPTKKLLICTDDCPELKRVQNAKYLIHYTLADTWSKFTFRFSSIAENFHNAVAANDDDGDELKVKAATQTKPVVLVVLEVGDTRWIMRLKNFMEKHNIDVPEFLTTLYKENLKKSEQKRNIKGLDLCPMLTTFGDCAEYGCNYRHLLTNEDIVPDDQTDHIPANGVIGMQILKVYSPAHFSVMVLKHQDPYSHKWRILRNDENSIALGFELNMYFADENKREMHWPPMVHDICVIKVGGQYRRVRITKVADLKHTHIVQPEIPVTLRVMDNNTDVLYRKASQLFHCPLKFRIMPAMAIDVRVIGLVPFDGERNWAPNAAKIVSNELLLFNKVKNEQLLGAIKFTLSHTIFLKNVVKVDYLATIKVHTNRFNLQKFLFNKQLGKMDEAVVIKLHEMFSDINMSTSDIQSLNSSNDEIELSVNTKPKQQKTIENSKEMFKFPSAKSIENIEQCETEIVESLSKRNSQESWCSLSINELAQIEILSEQDNGSWDGFYVIGMNNEHVVEFIDILKQTKDYIIEKQPENLTSMHQCKPGDNFIIEDGIKFLRAKLITEYASSNSDNLYRFLLVDSGCFIYLSASTLKNRRIYKSTNEIACSIPYQTIYCKLAGIVLRPNQKIVKATAKNLYVVAKRQCKTPLKDMKMHGYEVILFECDNADDLTSAIMLNKHLINLNVADYDEKTKADLEMHLKETRDSLKQLQQCLMNVEDYEIDTAKDFVKQLLGNEDQPKSTYKPEKQEDKQKPSDLILNDNDNSKQLSPNSQVIKPILSTTVYPTKCPQLTWFQNSGFINISVEASEVTDYLVFCNNSQLFYATMPPNESPAQLFHLNLCGYVEQVNHKKLGLCVIIKLRKKMCGLWPSLVEPIKDDVDFKLPFIKYNLDHLKIDPDEFSHVQLTQLALNRIEAGLHETRPTDEDDTELQKGNTSDNSGTESDTDKGPERDLKEYDSTYKFRN